MKNAADMVCLDDCRQSSWGAGRAPTWMERRSRAPPDEVAAPEAVGPFGHGGRGDQDAAVQPAGGQSVAGTPRRSAASFFTGDTSAILASHDQGLELSTQMSGIRSNVQVKLVLGLPTGEAYSLGH